MNEIFVSIYERLNTLLSVEVFDHVPQDYNNFPYVVIEPLSDGQNDTDTESGFNSTVQIKVWSDYRGSKETSDIQKQIYDGLHRWEMPDTASYGISQGPQQTIKTIVTNPDGISRQGVQRFQLFYEPLPN